MTDQNDVLEQVLADLAAESDQLDRAVADLEETGWRRPTPADGWDVASQIAHLAWTDEAAQAAASDKEAWDRLVLEALEDPERAVDNAAIMGGAVRPAELLDRWRRSRAGLATALREVPAGTKLPWFGPPMSPTSMATARFMETWAHALDVHTALGEVPAPTDRLKHVAHLGIRTRNFAFGIHQLTPPTDDFRVELTAPSGEVWVWGPEDTEDTVQTVTGSAYDFAQLVTQRVHRDDTDLVATGADAETWLGIAQAFAGPPGNGRAPAGGGGR